MNLTDKTTSDITAERIGSILGSILGSFVSGVTFALGVLAVFWGLEALGLIALSGAGGGQ